MRADEDIGVAERSPEAVLDFWLGRLRTAADTSRENWQQGMLRWRIGPFARSTEDPHALRVQREWCGLLCAARLAPEDSASPMDVFGLVGDDVVPWSVLYRHIRLPEHARTFDQLRQIPQVVDLANAVKTPILKDGEDLTWSPKSAKHSLESVIDVAALNALVLDAEGT